MRFALIDEALANAGKSEPGRMIVPLPKPGALPIFTPPVTLLFMMAIAMPLSFATWSALLNNFVIEAAQFDGSDIGWLHTVRRSRGFWP